MLDPDAEFEALSITKTMVAAVALQLVDEGEAHTRRTAPAHRGHRHGRHRHAHAAAILSHSTGLQDYRENPDYRDDMILTPVEAVNLWRQRPVARP